MVYRFLFIMDPISGISPAKDTTFAFMLAAQARGHELHYCEVGDLYVEACQPFARSHAGSVSLAPPHFASWRQQTLPLHVYHAIFMRKDPPVDSDYLYASQMLSLLHPPLPLLINNPRALRDANEKLYALHFPTLTPPTLVSRDLPQLRRFLDTLGGHMIVKPLDGYGGAGVLFLSRNDRNLNVLLELSTNNGTRLVLAQQYIQEIRQGDKRILLLDGEPLGAILRIPREDEHRGNLHVGGGCEATTLTDRDREIIRTLSPHLIAAGLFFVGIDVIGPFLTEVNVTSPTGIQELSQFAHHDYASDVIARVEARIAALP